MEPIRVNMPDGKLRAMRSALQVFLFVLLLGVGAWVALSAEGEDPAGRAQLLKWADGVTAQTASPVKGYRASLETHAVSEQEWELELTTGEVLGSSSDPAKKPTELRVQINNWSRSFPVDAAGKTFARIPWSAFRLHGRSNDVSFNLTSSDGSEFGGWAFHSMGFEEGKVTMVKATWLERLID